MEIATADRQRRLAREALSALAGTDFALAGAGAIREYGITERPTQDVDLFTDSVDPDAFTTAFDRLRASLAAADYTVDVVRRDPTFARLRIGDADGVELELDLAAERRWRTAEAVTLGVGPVLALRDAVGSKLGALFRRTAARDFLDVDAIRRSGHFTDAQLLEILASRDRRFGRDAFAGRLDRVSQLTAAEVEGYGVGADELAGVRRRLTAWVRELRS